jgi:ABC-type nitrate/sulfonate/bicarbonate transport system permease component
LVGAAQDPMNMTLRMTKLGWSSISVLLAVAAWAALSAAMKQPELLPGPLAIWDALIGMLVSGELARAIYQSLVRFCIGYLAGALLGIMAGVALGRSKIAYECFGLVFEFMKGIPPIALAPIVIIWLGIGEVSKYVVIGYIVFIVVAISTATGAQEIPLVRLRTGAFMGLGKIDTFRRIVMPSIMSFVLIGLRNGIGFGFVALVSAELIAANSGVGQIIMDARFSLQTDRMIVGLLALGSLGVIIQAGFDGVVACIPVLKRL